MVLDAWVMIGGWDFLDEFEVDRFLDKMETARASHLAFGGIPPLQPNPRHCRGSRVKGECPPVEIMAREGAVRAVRGCKEQGIRLVSVRYQPPLRHQYSAYNSCPSSASSRLKPRPWRVTGRPAPKAQSFCHITWGV